MAVTRGSSARIGVDVLKVLEGNEARDTEEALEDQASLLLNTPRGN